MTGLMSEPDVIAAGTVPDAWDAPPRRPSASAAPVLAVAGFEGPLDWLLQMAHAQWIDLSKLSIVQLVNLFTTALERALTEGEVRVDLTRWGEWLVMAATVALLRSRLLLPPDAPEARAAQAEAEVLRRLLLDRAAVRQAAAWLDRRTQLGRDVFARGGVTAAGGGRATDINDLFRACLVALRVPEQDDTYQLRFRKLWRVSDAMAWIARLLAARPEGGVLSGFLPLVDGEGRGPRAALPRGARQHLPGRSRTGACRHARTAAGTIVARHRSPAGRLETVAVSRRRPAQRRARLSWQLGRGADRLVVT